MSGHYQKQDSWKQRQSGICKTCKKHGSSQNERIMEKWDLLNTSIKLYVPSLKLLTEIWYNLVSRVYTKRCLVNFILVHINPTSWSSNQTSVSLKMIQQTKLFLHDMTQVALGSTTLIWNIFQYGVSLIKYNIYSPSWEANSHSLLKVHYCVYKSLLLIPILSHFNIIFPSMPKSFEWSLPFRFSD